MKALIFSTSLSMTSPIQSLDARCHAIMAYSIFDFARQAQQAKGRLKNINGQINISGLLVFHQLTFMVNLP